jgi:protein-S-isoprenylcysteine O-methyltransferase Ste14
MKKLNFFGVGPKIAIILLPWLAITITLSCINKSMFNFGHAGSKVLLIAGFILLAFGLVFYFSTVFLLLKGLKNTQLVTNGAFSLCQNPLYSAIVLFIIPSVSLILNSWFILTSACVGYILFKIYIKKEYAELEEFFGESYLNYKNTTPEFFPFPIKKWFS